MRSWHGPNATPLQRRLLDACLDPNEARAAEAWRDWRSRCDFDEEDAASNELASYAAGRLGAEAAGAAESARSLGWQRRAWYVSELAAGAARGLAAACRERGLEAIALGDLAASRRGLAFAGRRLPIRAIEILVPQVDRGLRSELLSSIALAAARQAIEGHRLSCVVLDASQDRFAVVDEDASREGDGLALPTLGSMLARLAARNWCWNPPDRLRWMLEAVAILDAHPVPSQLGEEMRSSLDAAQAGRAAELALRALRSIVPAECGADRRARLDLAIDAAASVRGGPRARLRAWTRRHSPDSLIARGHRTLGRWRRSLRLGD
ncbi:MAG: hypothetical protein ACO3NL_10295 [Phycisphaerales bacterium]